MEFKHRLSSIRAGLENAGFSPDEIHQIIAEALERRKGKQEEQQESGREGAILVLVLATVVVVVTYLLAAPGGLYLVPVGLFSYGFYLWYGKPKGRDGQP